MFRLTIEAPTPGQGPGRGKRRRSLAGSFPRNSMLLNSLLLNSFSISKPGKWNCRPLEVRRNSMTSNGHNQVGISLVSPLCPLRWNRPVAGETGAVLR
jgi:hypothetical protein